MENKELQYYIICGIFNTEPKDMPRYAEDLDIEMFSPDNRKMLEVLLSGERDLKVLGDVSGWRYSRVVDFLIDENKYKFLSEGLVKELKEYYLRDSAVKALEDNDWEKLGQITNTIQSVIRKDPMKAYDEFKEQFKEVANSGRLGASTGIEALDEATKGLIPGHIWVCGAYYGQGKTYMAINFLNSLLSQGKRVMFVSLEMPVEEIIQRFVSLRAGLNLIETLSDLDEYKSGLRKNAEEFIREKIKSGDLLLDSDSRNINSVSASILKEEIKRHIDFVSIDYIQLLANPSKQYESTSEAVQKLQGLAKKIKTTIMMLSQVNNASQKEGDGRMVDGFKGAGDIGQVANVAIRIERERDEVNGEYSNYFGIRLTKIRHGRPTKIDCIIEFPGGKIRSARPGEIQAPVKKLSKMDKIFAGLQAIDEPIVD